MSVVDASVWVSLLQPAERHHRRCADWLERSLAEEHGLAAPTLLLAEVAAAIRRLTGNEELVAAAVSSIEEAGILELVPLSEQRARRAAEIAGITAVRGADAVYLELARDRGDVLVSLDRQQLERGRAVASVERP